MTLFWNALPMPTHHLKIINALTTLTYHNKKPHKNFFNPSIPKLRVTRVNLKITIQVSEYIYLFTSHNRNRYMSIQA